MKTKIRWGMWGVRAFIVVAGIMISQPALAQPFGIVLGDFDDVRDRILCPIAQMMFNILIILSVIFIIWAAYVYLTAEGESEKITKARRIIVYAVVAILVAFLANAIPGILSNFFGSTGIPPRC